MIINPDNYLDQIKEAGASNITVHHEACTHLHRTIQHIKNLGCKAGVAINPHTPVHLLSEIIPDIDLVCMMSVNPGFGGQQFIENTYQKINDLRTLANKRNKNLLIQVDGGVNSQNAAKLVQAGANVLVAGNAIFKDEDPRMTIRNLAKPTIL